MNLIRTDTAGNVFLLLPSGEGTVVKEEYLYNENEIEKPIVICDANN